MDWTGVCLLLACICFVSGAPQVASGGDKDAKILNQSSDVSPEGGYEWSYETDNGIKAQETGTLKKSNDPENGDAVIAQGSYSYKDPEGNEISITYVADDVGGFQPQGAHIPTPPPIPANIQRALDWIASQPSTTEKA